MASNDVLIDAFSRVNDAVPTVIIDDRYMISGGQPADAFERALRKSAAMAA